MRVIILILAITSFIPVRAQMYLPVSGVNDMQPNAFNLRDDSNGVQKRWSVSMYGGLAAGIGFFNGGNAAFLPAQIGLQLNRRLNNNLYAFAGVSAAPVFF